MNSTLLVTVLTLVFGLVTGATGQESGFYRIVSTQGTHVVSLNAAGLLVWSNTVPNAPCQIQVKRTVDSVWTNDFPTSPLRTNGFLTQARVPMYRIFSGWIVAFQPGVTLAQAEALFEANELIWEPAAWNSLRMAKVYIPRGKSISVVSNSPDVRYVEPDYIIGTD